MNTYQDFKKAYLGKAVDIDGYFGAQCWDGAMFYSQWLGYPVFHCWNGTGYAQDIWTGRKTSGILNYYDEVSVMQPGDIAVFKPCAATPDSHIAMFDSDAGGGYGWFLGQNQGGAGGAFNLVKLPYSALYDTALRPKKFSAKTKPSAATVNEAVKRPATIKAGKERSVYRLYNPNNGDHILTTSVQEANLLQDGGWAYEGVAWIYPSDGDPVWRLRNPNTTQHHYTASEKEKTVLVKAGWTNEGIVMRSGGSKPIYRLYNPNSGCHVLTATEREHNALCAAGWRCEGQDLHAEAV